MTPAPMPELPEVVAWCSPLALASVATFNGDSVWLTPERRDDEQTTEPLVTLAACEAYARAYAAALAGDGAAWQAVLAVALEMQDSGWVSTDPHEIHAWAGQIVGAIPQHAIDARAAIAKATP